MAPASQRKGRVGPSDALLEPTTWPPSLSAAGTVPGPPSVPRSITSYPAGVTKSWPTTGPAGATGASRPQAAARGSRRQAVTRRFIGRLHVGFPPGGGKPGALGRAAKSLWLGRQDYGAAPF